MSRNAVEQIKERLPIHELIAEYLTLERAGGAYKALCPFHNEKTASMSISPDRGTFYCFGCGAKGDIFSFIEHMEGLDFLGALRMLSERTGVPLEEYTKTARDDHKRLYAILEDATKFFEHVYSITPDAETYITERGISEKTAKDFRIGYAPQSWRSLTSWLKKKGHKEKDIEAVGLTKRTEKGMYDRFRGRVMFPIFDAAGRVIAYSGRILPKYKTDNQGKYINSPETTLYRKSDVLYGYDRAKQAIREQKEVLIVEGQMDLVMAHQVGTTHTVALSGTALTDTVLERLSHHAKKIILALDADTAGLRAAQKSGIAALKHGFDVNVLPIPEDMDPADIIKDDVSKWTVLLEKQLHIVDQYLAHIEKMSGSEKEKLTHAQELLFPLLKAIKSPVEQEQAIRTVARGLSASEEAVTKELALIEEPKAPVAPVVQQKTKEDDVSRERTIILKLGGLLIWIKKQKELKCNTEDIVKGMKRILGKPPEYAPAEYEPYIFETESRYENPRCEECMRDCHELLHNLEELRLKNELEDITRLLRGSPEEEKELLKRHGEITKQLAALNTKYNY